MKKRTRVLAAISFVACLLLTLSYAPASLAKDETRSESSSEGFRANLVDSAGLLPGATTAFFRLQIEEYGDVTAARNLLELLEEEGQQSLRDRLEGQSVGWIQIGSTSVSYPVAFARTFEEEDGGRVVRAVIAREMGFFELSRNLRTTDYPFSVVELRIDENAEGSGVFVLATRLDFNDQGSLVVENYNASPLTLLNVKPVATK